MSVRILLIAHHNLGSGCLQYLHEGGQNVVGVIAHHEEPGPLCWYASVEELARQLKVDLLTPETLCGNSEALDWVRQRQPDIIYSLYTRFIILREILDIPRLGTYNVHPSFLPRYRGCFSLVWAIIQGETETGITVHCVDEGIDTGDIVAQRVLPIRSDDTGRVLYERATDVAFNLFCETHPKLVFGNVQPVPQNHTQATYYSRQLPFGGLIDWHQPPQRIYDFVRAIRFDPFPAAHTFLNDDRVEILAVTPLSGKANAEPGTVVSWDAGRIIVAATDGCVQIDLVRSYGSQVEPFCPSDLLGRETGQNQIRFQSEAIERR